MLHVSWKKLALQIIIDENIRKPDVKLYQSKFYVTAAKKDDAAIDKSMGKWYCKKTKEKKEECNEMCHKYYKNYSKEFWELLSSIMPDNKN